MAFTKTRYYDEIIARHIKSGRASNKTETVHQALTLLDVVTRGAGPGGATFTGAEDLETVLLEGLRPVQEPEEASAMSDNGCVRSNQKIGDALPGTRASCDSRNSPRLGSSVNPPSFKKK
jgi:hypothetical protein